MTFPVGLPFVRGALGFILPGLLFSPGEGFVVVLLLLPLLLLPLFAFGSVVDDDDGAEVIGRPFLLLAARFSSRLSKRAFLSLSTESRRSCRREM